MLWRNQLMQILFLSYFNGYLCGVIFSRATRIDVAELDQDIYSRHGHQIETSDIDILSTRHNKDAKKGSSAYVPGKKKEKNFSEFPYHPKSIIYHGRKKQLLKETHGGSSEKEAAFASKKDGKSIEMHGDYDSIGRIMNKKNNYMFHGTGVGGQNAAQVNTVANTRAATLAVQIPLEGTQATTALTESPRKQETEFLDEENFFPIPERFFKIPSSETELKELVKDSASLSLCFRNDSSEKNTNKRYFANEASPTSQGPLNYASDTNTGLKVGLCVRGKSKLTITERQGVIPGSLGSSSNLAQIITFPTHVVKQRKLNYGITSNENYRSFNETQSKNTSDDEMFSVVNSFEMRQENNRLPVNRNQKSNFVTFNQMTSAMCREDNSSTKWTVKTVDLLLNDLNRSTCWQSQTLREIFPNLKTNYKAGPNEQLNPSSNVRNIICFLLDEVKKNCLPLSYTLHAPEQPPNTTPVLPATTQSRNLDRILYDKQVGKYQIDSEKDMHLEWENGMLFY